MPVCDFLLAINTNRHPISYRFGVIAAYCSNFGHCVLESPLVDLGTTYDVHLRLHWKACSVLHISVNWTYFDKCYGAALRAKIDRKTAFWKPVGQYVSAI